MRATIFTLACLIASAGTAVAQTPAPAAPAEQPAPAAPSAPAAPAEPAAAPASEPAAAQPAAPQPAAGGEQPAAPAAQQPGATPLNPYAPGAADQAAREHDPERIRRERAAMEAMLARARAAHARTAAREPVEREPEPPPVHGDAGAAFAIGLSVDAIWNTDPGYDVFAEDDVTPRFGLWASYDVAALRDDAFAAIEVGWGHESESARVLGVASTELRTNVAYAGVNLRWVPIDFLQPHLRLAGGAALVDATLTAGQTFHDGAGGLFDDLISPFGSAGLGFTLRTRTRAFEDRRGKLASLSFGLMVEGGYTLAAPIEVALDGPGPSARDIPLAEPELGDLDRSGPYIRVSLVGRM